MSRSSAHSPSGVAQRRLAHVAQRRCRARGLAYPEVSAGNDVPGQLDLPATIRALHRLAVTRAPSAELIAHPGGPDDPDRDRYAWGYRWDDELASLTSGTVRHAVKEYGFRLGTYADLPGAAGRGDRHAHETAVGPPRRTARRWIRPAPTPRRARPADDRAGPPGRFRIPRR